MSKCHLRALTTNYIFSDQVSFIPEGAGGVNRKSSERRRIVAVSGSVITCSEEQAKEFLKRNERGSKKWQDVTSLVGLDDGDPHKVHADPPAPGFDDDEEPEPQASEALNEFAGRLAEDLHEAGFVGIHEIAGASLAQLTAIRGIGEPTAKELKASAEKAVSELDDNGGS